MAEVPVQAARPEVASAATGITVLRLASRSPRRRALLEQVGIRCTVCGADIDEALRTGEGAAEHVTRLAVAKAQRVAALWSGLPVLGADTCVALDDLILGKPADASDAGAMLRSLSGRSHRVFTGVALVNSGSVQTALSVSEVFFEQLSDAQIAAYWRTGEAQDKAGGYAIQG
ncbi:MAG: Maf family protein, partial [Gammaproteobacteria bacterium]|nr:Maf family protein [Gammaproteobacteria bacterium]